MNPNRSSENRSDLAQLWADDAALRDLQEGGIGHADDPAIQALARWRAEVDADPYPELDLDVAMATIAQGRNEYVPPPVRQLRPAWRVPMAAALAAFALLGTGMASVVEQAGPGDALWGAAQVLHTERAESVLAAARVQERIARAKRALVAGRPQDAKAELNAALVDLRAVRVEEGQIALLDVQTFLMAKAVETPLGVPVDPATPLRRDPLRPVPPGCGLGVVVPGVPVVPIVLPLPLPAPAPAVPVIAAPAPVPVPAGQAPQPVQPGPGSVSGSPGGAPPVITISLPPPVMSGSVPSGPTGDGGGNPVSPPSPADSPDPSPPPRPDFDPPPLPVDVTTVVPVPDLPSVDPTTEPSSEPTSEPSSEPTPEPSTEDTPADEPNEGSVLEEVSEGVTELADGLAESAETVGDGNNEGGTGPKSSTE